MHSLLLLQLAMLCSVIAIGYSYPATLDDIFPGFVQNTHLNIPDKTGELKKRRVEENQDADLKQVSLQSLIGGLENSFFQSALSVSSVAHNNGVLAEIKPASAEHTVAKRQTDSLPSDSVAPTTEPLPNGKKILLQTTEKIPAHEGIPSHILIDRISVQPHSGGIPLIPAFQIQHTKLISATIKDPDGNNPTKISITKTDYKATGSTVEQITEKSTTTTTTDAADASTKVPIVKLKEAEQELKEKVAEIEAEPVILTARV